MLSKLIDAMIHSFAERRYVEHALKVLGYARCIGGGEGLGGDEMTVLEAAATVHDIGIPDAIRIHGSGAGPYQEKEGARIAPPMVLCAGYDQATADRVGWLVGHHHTLASAGDDFLLQILLEADDLVNLSEGNASAERIASSRKNVFKTPTGLRLLDVLFPPEG
jgi:hypothetical protein